jgi:hypothetical protein
MSKNTADFLAREQQYLRDRARLDAHRLGLKDDEFGCLVEQVRKEVRAHTSYQQQRHASLVLNDRDSRVISTEYGQQVTTITFNAVRHQVQIKKTGIAPVSYEFNVDVSNDKPIIVGRKWSEPLSVVNGDAVIDAIRHAIDALIE